MTKVSDCGKGNGSRELKIETFEPGYVCPCRLRFIVRHTQR